MPDTVLILGGSRWQIDMVRAARRAGLRVLVTDIQENPPARAYSDDFVCIDTNDCDGLLKVARDKNVRFAIAEQTDRTVPIAAFLNEQLGARGIAPEVARRFTDKYAMRNALRDAPVPMPRYAEVGSVGEALEHARAWGYPAVLKPKRLQSSIGVFKVKDDAELSAMFERSMGFAADGRILVEEFIEGTEITVEGLSAAGRCTIMAVSEKRHYPFNDCVARRISYPPRFPAEVIARIRRTAATVVDALGLQDGISHAEYRVRDGVPYLVEVAARGGGTRIASTIVSHVSGVDMYDLLLRRYCGEDVVVPTPLNRAAVLDWPYFELGTIKAIHGLEEVRARGIVADIELAFQPGDTLVLPQDDKTRHGHFIVLGDTRDEVDAISQTVRESLSVDYAD